MKLYFAVNDEDYIAVERLLGNITSAEDEEWAFWPKAFYDALRKRNLYICEQIVNKKISLNSSNGIEKFQYMGVALQHAVFIDDIDLLKIASKACGEEYEIQHLRDRDTVFEIKSQGVCDFLIRRGFFPIVNDVLIAAKNDRKEVFETMLCFNWSINKIAKIYYGCKKLEEKNMAKSKYSESALNAFKNGKYRDSCFNTKVSIWGI